MADEVGGAFERDGQDRCDRLRVPDDRCRGAACGVGVELGGGAGFLQRRETRGELLWEVDLDFADVGLRAERRRGSVSFAVRLAPSALLVLPWVETVKLGLNLRLEQSAAWNGALALTGVWSAGLAGPRRRRRSSR